MQGRTTNIEAIKVLTSHNISMIKPPKTADGGSYVSDDKHTPHFWYMKLIGSVQQFSRHSDSEVFDSPKCELILDKVNLYVEAYEMVNNRKKYLVFEDNFQSSIASMIRDVGQ